MILFFYDTFAGESAWDLVPKQRFLDVRPGAHGSFVLRPGFKTVMSSDNGKLKISSEEVVYNGKSISYSQLAKKKPGPREAQFIEIPGYPFLKYYPIEKTIQVEIENIGEGNFSIQLDRESYLFTAPPKSEYSVLSFNTFFEPGSKQDEVLHAAQKDQSLQEFLKKIEFCATKKDIECFKGLASPKSDLEKTILRRIVFDDPKTCKIYGKINNRDLEENVLPDHLIKSADVQKTDLWRNIKDAAILNSLNNYILFTNVNYFANKTDSVTIIRKISKMNPCDNYKDLYLVLEKYSGEWKIGTLVLTSNDGY